MIHDSGIGSCVFVRVASDVTKDPSAIILRGKKLKNNERLKTTGPVTHCHIQNTYFQQNRCEKLGSQNSSTITVLVETAPRPETLIPYTKLDGFISHPVYIH
jgi:hypothetical protein